MKRSAEVPVICDGIWPTAWPKDETAIDDVPASLYDNTGGGTSMNIGNNWTRICVARHRSAINVGFMDGHVTTTELQDLWNLPWHRQWNKTHFNYDTVKDKVKSRFKG